MGPPGPGISRRGVAMHFSETSEWATHIDKTQRGSDCQVQALQEKNWIDLVEDGQHVGEEKETTHVLLSIIKFN